jgi:hypothetical protein
MTAPGPGRYREVVVARLNTRQLEVLRWIGDGCPEGHWRPADFSYKTSALALKDRGLVTIKGRARTWAASVTEVGTHYLEHGSFPPGYRTAAKERTKRSADESEQGSRQPLRLSNGASKTLADAKDLIRQLQDEGTVTVADPAQSTRARYRRVLHACRVHALVPDGWELLYTGRDTGDIVIALSDGSAKATSDWLRVRTTSRRVTTNVDSVRQAVENTPAVLKVSDDLRPRAIEVVKRLAHALRDHDLRLGVNTKLKTPRLYVQVDTRRRDLVLEEALKEVPHVLTPAEERQARRSTWTSFPKTDRVRSGNLRLTVARDGWNKVDEWIEAPGSRLKPRVDEIALAIKAGVVDDDDARQRETQAREEASERWERERAEQRRAWEQLRESAVEKAQVSVRRSIVGNAMEAWLLVAELRSFCEALEGALATDPYSDTENVRRWIAWAREQADDLDPTQHLDRLNAIDFEVVPADDDLRPFMEGWSPSGPQKDYSAPPPADPQPPQRSPWHPGLRGKPSWWR